MRLGIENKNNIQCVKPILFTCFFVRLGCKTLVVPGISLLNCKFLDVLYLIRALFTLNVFEPVV